MPSSRAMPSLERSPGKRDNWVEAVGGLPSYIERIAKQLHYTKGFTIRRAIATAVNTVKKWARGGDDVSAETRAKAIKAVAEWRAKVAASGGPGSLKGMRGKKRDMSHGFTGTILDLGKVVRTPAGAAFYGVPIGTMITVDVQERRRKRMEINRRLREQQRLQRGPVDRGSSEKDTKRPGQRQRTSTPRAREGQSGVTGAASKLGLGDPKEPVARSVIRPTGKERLAISEVLERHRGTVTAELAKSNIQKVELTVPGMGRIVVSALLAAEILGINLEKEAA